MTLHDIEVGEVFYLVSEDVQEPYLMVKPPKYNSMTSHERMAINLNNSHAVYLPLDAVVSVSTWELRV